jgi:hypothetical protein
MQQIHEFGHVLGAWLTGAEVTQVVLHPLTISRTDLAHNPRPLVVVWAGPVIGALLPMLFWTVASGLRLPAAFLLRFFAGFCLIANGAYIAGGSFHRVGDCGQMLEQASPMPVLWLFGAVTIPMGLWLWHKQGAHFGFGEAKEKVSATATYASLVVVAWLVTLGLLVDGR